MKARDEFEQGQDRGEHERDCGGGAGLARPCGVCRVGCAVWKLWKEGRNV